MALVLGHALGDGEPGMLVRHEGRVGRRWEGRIRKQPDRHPCLPGTGLRRPKHRRTAIRGEMAIHEAAAVPPSRVKFHGTVDGHHRCRVVGVHAASASGSPLAILAEAHRNNAGIAGDADFYVAALARTGVNCHTAPEPTFAI